MLIDFRTRARSLAFAPRRGDFRRIFREQLHALAFAQELGALENTSSPEPKVSAPASPSAFTLDHADSLAWLAFRACLRPASQDSAAAPTVPAVQPQVEEVIGGWAHAAKTRKPAREPRTIDSVFLREA